MKAFTLTASLMAAGLLLAAPAFAQSPSAQKQPTQDGGGGAADCRSTNAYRASTPDCQAFLQRTQNLSPTSSGDAEAPKAQK
jgi:hypothetical protein